MTSPYPNIRTVHGSAMAEVSTMIDSTLHFLPDNALLVETMKFPHQPLRAQCALSAADVRFVGVAQTGTKEAQHGNKVISIAVGGIVTAPIYRERNKKEEVTSIQPKDALLIRKNDKGFIGIHKVNNKKIKSEEKIGPCVLGTNCKTDLVTTFFVGAYPIGLDFINSA